MRQELENYQRGVAALQEQMESFRLPEDSDFTLTSVWNDITHCAQRFTQYGALCRDLEDGKSVKAERLNDLMGATAMAYNSFLNSYYNLNPYDQPTLSAFTAPMAEMMQQLTTLHGAAYTAAQEQVQQRQQQKEARAAAQQAAQAAAEAEQRRRANLPLEETLNELDIDLKNADPTFVSSSREFKAMRKAYENVRDTLRRTKANPSAEELDGLAQMLDDLHTKTISYYNYSANRSNDELGKTGMARRDFSERLGDFAIRFRREMESRAQQRRAEAQQRQAQSEANAQREADRQNRINNPELQKLSEALSRQLTALQAGTTPIRRLTRTEEQVADAKTGKSRSVVHFAPGTDGAVLATLTPGFIAKHQKAALDTLVQSAVGKREQENRKRQAAGLPLRPLDDAARQKFTVNAYRQLAQQNLAVWTNYLRGGPAPDDTFVKNACAQAVAMVAGEKDGTLRAQEPAVPDQIIFGLDMLNRAASLSPQLDAHFVLHGQLLSSAMSFLSSSIPENADRYNVSLSMDGIDDVTPSQRKVLQSARGLVQLSEAGLDGMEAQQAVIQQLQQSDDPASVRIDRSTAQRLAVAELGSLYLHRGYEKTQRAINAQRPVGLQAQTREKMPVPTITQISVADDVKSLDEENMSVLKEQVSELPGLDVFTNVDPRRVIGAISTEFNVANQLEQELTAKRLANRRSEMRQSLQELWKQLDDADPALLRSSDEFKAMKASLKSLRDAAGSARISDRDFDRDSRAKLSELLHTSEAYIRSKDTSELGSRYGEMRITAAKALQEYALELLPEKSRTAFRQQQLDALRAQTATEKQTQIMAEYKSATELLHTARSSTNDVFANEDAFFRKVRQEQLGGKKLGDYASANKLPSDVYRVGRNSPTSACIMSLLAKGYPVEDVIDPTKLPEEKAQAGREFVEHFLKNDVDWYGRTIADGWKVINNYMEGLQKDGMDFGDIHSLAPHMKTVSALSFYWKDTQQEFDYSEKLANAAVDHMTKDYGGDVVSATKELGLMCHRASALASYLNGIQQGVKGLVELTGSEPPENGSSALHAALLLPILSKTVHTLGERHPGEFFTDHLANRLADMLVLDLGVKYDHMVEQLGSDPVRSAENCHLLAAGILSGKLDDFVQVEINEPKMDVDDKYRYVPIEAIPDGKGGHSIQPRAAEDMSLEPSFNTKALTDLLKLRHAEKVEITSRLDPELIKDVQPAKQPQAPSL